MVAFSFFSKVLEEDLEIVLDYSILEKTKGKTLSPLHDFKTSQLLNELMNVCSQLQMKTGFMCHFANKA